MDIEKLIESVRLCGSTPKVDQCKQCAYWAAGDMSRCIPNMTGDAATALSTLRAENTQLRAELNDLKAQWDMYAGDEGITAAFAELERVKRDRDSIEQDFRAFAKQWWEEDSGFPCRWCKFEQSGGCEWKAKQPNEEKICAGRAFEWRGPQKED